MPGEKGYCHVRENKEGVLYSLVYGKAVAVNVDPIEKKPFYHFMPGTQSFSFSTVGCNFRCLYCQNWEISQAYPGIVGEDWSPERIVSYCTEGDIPGIAYTYTEPTVFMEYSLDTAKLAHQKNIFNVFVTNGYMSDAAVKEMSGRIDASRIDLKGFKEKCLEAGLGDTLLYLGGNLAVGRHDFKDDERKFKDMGFDRVYPPEVDLAVAVADLSEDLKKR